MIAQTVQPKTSVTRLQRPADISEECWQLVLDQGVAESARYENLLGAGEDLWDSEEDFQIFLDGLERIRQQRD